MVSQYITLNMWLALVSILFFAYDGKITPLEGSLLLFINVVCLINVSRINRFLFGVKENK